MHDDDITTARLALTLFRAQAFIERHVSGCFARDALLGALTYWRNELTCTDDGDPSPLRLVRRGDRPKAGP